MLCPRGGDRHGRREGGRDVENSEDSEGGGSDAAHHCYPAGQKGRGGERAAAAAAAWSACSIFVSVVCTRKGRLCIEPSLQARQSKGAERPTRLELQGPGAPQGLVRSDGPRNLFQRQPATR
eukprot:scaffold9421_cov51-Phaeocystis_antarctica.AAC.3